METSQQLFARACRRIPWGTQTHAKRPDPALDGVMPLFIESADGCRIQDVDGNWFIDYRMALGPIILGYRYGAVEAAVREQMDRGVLFSMASPLEIEVAEALAEAVPSLEQVRFLKTGNEANAASVRLARAFTGRDHLVTCGYHGHGDWFACGTGAPTGSERAGNGVPAALDALVTRIAYGDVEAAERLFAERGTDVAAVLMVPYDWEGAVARTFVERMRALTRQHGSLLIFDQVLTGFRLDHGGAEAYLGVQADLSTFAKALANGYPLAAFGGRRDVMDVLSRVRITSTYAGETLSLAAARATLAALRQEPVLAHIWRMGQRLQDGFDAAARRHGLPARSYGLPPAIQLRFSNDAQHDAWARGVFFRSLYRKGIFAARPFLLSYAHRPEDVDETLAAIETSMADLADQKPAAAGPSS